MLLAPQVISYTVRYAVNEYRGILSASQKIHAMKS